MGEFEPRVELVPERPAVHRLAPLACAGGIATLDHKVFDDAVERRAIVVTFHAQLRKVANGLQVLLLLLLGPDAQGRRQMLIGRLLFCTTA